MKFVREHPMLVIITIILIALAYYWFVFSVYSHRYRLTIEVDTPSGLKTGSAVLEPRARTQSPGLSGRSVVPRLRGEAVFVDLGGDKNVVGLLAGGGKVSSVDAPIRLAMRAFDALGCRGAMCDWQRMQSMSGRKNLSEELVPTLVTFSNPRDPRTVRLVRPGEFERAFGPGYRFRRAWIEMTDDPVTQTIQNALPWLNEKWAVSKFWESLYGNGFRPNGNIGARTMLVRGQ
jgi:hypothetical protein